MATKIISNTYTAGYFLGAQYDTVTITSGGSVGGSGLVCDATTTVVNFGSLNGSNKDSGLFLAGGRVTNETRAVISGHVGVYSTGALYVSNRGRIASTPYEAIRALSTLTMTNANNGLVIGGVYMNNGSIYNGPNAAFESNIFSANGAKIDNRGDILSSGGVYIRNADNAGGWVANTGYIGATAPGPGHIGVNLGGTSGFVLNGWAGFSGTLTASGVIVGYTAVLVDGYGYVGNGGSISGKGKLTGAYGVLIGQSAHLANGDASDAGALIEGYGAVRVGGQGFAVNYGTIQSQGTAVAGVSFAGGGLVDNLGQGRIAGGLGVEVAGAAGEVFNTATIEGASGYGVEFLAGGTVINSGTAALISGGSGAGLFAPGTVTNSGVIEALGSYGRGVYMTGGLLTNGAASDTSALIAGGEFGAMLLDGPTAVVNYGVILSTRTDLGAGVHLENGSLVNGAKTDTGALLYGFVGLTGGYAHDTVTNFGTIWGSSGAALTFSSATDALIVEAGCAFIGSVTGGGGTLVLDSGTGTLGLPTDETETVFGSMAKTTFSAFATVEVAAGAAFTGSGKATIAKGQSIIDLGHLTLGSSTKGVANAGTLSIDGGTFVVAGAVTGGGVATIDGGLLDFAAAFDQNVTFVGGGGTLELARSPVYGGTISGFSRKGKTFLDLDDIAFGKHTKATYSGTSKGGVLTVTDGTHTAHIALKGDYLASTFVVASDGHGGTQIHDPPAPPTPQAFASAMASIAAPAGATQRVIPPSIPALDHLLAARP